MLGFSQRGFFSLPPSNKDGGLPVVGSPRLFIQYICIYSPYWKLSPPSVRDKVPNAN